MLLADGIITLATIRPTGPFGRALACLLMAAYKRRLRAVVAAAPAWVSEEIPSASERIGDDRAVLWTSKNWAPAACCAHSRFMLDCFPTQSVWRTFHQPHRADL